jgi:hypothetical protein
MPVLYREPSLLALDTILATMIYSIDFRTHFRRTGCTQLHSKPSGSATHQDYLIVNIYICLAIEAGRISRLVNIKLFSYDPLHYDKATLA